jgi:formyltetrahydrofolate deformylase
VDLDQHVDVGRGVFFMRVACNPATDDAAAIEQFQRAFAAAVASPCDMHWRLERASRRTRMAIFVSKYGHCLYDILSRWESGEWAVDLPLIVSNHRDLEPVAQRHGIRFEHVPVTAATRAKAERRQLGLLRETGVDLVVLARAVYAHLMHQILVYDNRTVVFD